MTFKVIKQMNVTLFSILTFASSLFAKDDMPYRTLILEQTVISKETDRYCGWPSIAKTADGKLIVVYSGDRDWHVCPWGKIQMVISDDNGQTWSSPATIVNTPLDDRDAGLLVTRKGTILVNWFTSLEFANKKSRLYFSRYAQYAEHTASLSEEIRQQWLGDWIWRSEDGITGTLIQVPFSTPHGPIQLADGRILLITSRGVAESVDDGLTWRVLQQFHRDDYGLLSEVYGVETVPGKILALSRALRMRQFGSDDGGTTWTMPFETNIQGYPPHIIKLDNGWLVAVYGRRYGDPMGQFACISRDNGLTWEVENEITLSIADKHHMPDGPIEDKRVDLGYPCSVLLDDGQILTVYYQTDQNGEWPSILGTRWKIEK